MVNNEIRYGRSPATGASRSYVVYQPIRQHVRVHLSGSMSHLHNGVPPHVAILFCHEFCFAGMIQDIRKFHFAIHRTAQQHFGHVRLTTSNRSPTREIVTTDLSWMLHGKNKPVARKVKSSHNRSTAKLNRIHALAKIRMPITEGQELLQREPSRREDQIYGATQSDKPIGLHGASRDKLRRVCSVRNPK